MEKLNELYEQLEVNCIEAVRDLDAQGLKDLAEILGVDTTEIDIFEAVACED